MTSFISGEWYNSNCGESAIIKPLEFEGIGGKVCKNCTSSKIVYKNNIYKLYWMGGMMEIVSGINIDDAITKSKFNKEKL